MAHTLKLSHRVCGASVASLGLTLALATPARTDEIYTFVVKKQEEKVQKRWNLTDWLETRDKMRLMDLWLALHSPSPYEFFLGGAFQSNEISPIAGTSSGWFGSFAAFASIFGLEAEIDRPGNSDAHFSTSFDLRIFGYHDQSTNITLQAGVRSGEYAGDDYRNALAGLRMSIYLGKYFGIGGLYRHFFDSTPVSSPFVSSGNRYEGQAFIDFRFLRVFGLYYVENETNSALSSEFGRKGFQLGARFYF